MPTHFYLKVAFQNKIKKYAISTTKQINFHHIHSSLGIPQPLNDSLFYYQLQLSPGLNIPNTLLTQQQIIQELSHMSLTPNTTIKMKIMEKKVMSEEQKRRKESQQSLEIPITVDKKRSRSVELTQDVFDQTCQTQLFDSSINLILPNQKANNQSSFSQKQTNNPQFPHQPTQWKNKFQDPKDTDPKPINIFAEPTVPELKNIVPSPKNKLFSKSTQIHKNIVRQNNNNNNRMTSSSPSTIDMSRISTLLQQSMRVSRIQKDELQRLENLIAKRQQQKLKVKQLKLQQINEVFELFGIPPKAHF